MSKSNETLKSTLAEIFGGFQDEEQRNDIARYLEEYLYHYMHIGDVHIGDVKDVQGN